MEALPSHADVLEGYQRQCPNGWTSGPNDGNFYQNLARHLLPSDRTDERHQVLIASPDWIQASKRACQGYQNYAADLDLAISALQGQSSPADVLVLVQLHTTRHVVRHLMQPDNSRPLGQGSGQKFGVAILPWTVGFGYWLLRSKGATPRLAVK